MLAALLNPLLQAFLQSGTPAEVAAGLPIKTQGGMLLPTCDRACSSGALVPPTASCSDRGLLSKNPGRNYTRPPLHPPPFFRNKKSAQRGSFGADIGQKLRSALQILEKYAFWHGHSVRTSMKNFGLKNFGLIFFP